MARKVEPGARLEAAASAGYALVDLFARPRVLLLDVRAAPDGDRERAGDAAATTVVALPADPDLTEDAARALLAPILTGLAGRAFQAGDV